MSSGPPEGRPRLRVLRLITRLNVGGPALQALLLTERLDATLFDPRLVTGRADEAEGDMQTLRPTRVRPTLVRTLHREIAPIADARSLAAITRIIRTFRPHVVHTHMAKAGLLGRVAARLAGTPIVLHTFHGDVLREYFDPLRSRAFVAVERALARMSTRVIAISPRQREEIRTLGIAREERIVEMPLGVELEPFLDIKPGSLKHELLVDEGRPLIGLVGRLVAIKAVDVFIEAMAILRRSFDEARFVVVGDGELRPSLEALARARGLGDRLTFIGWRSDLTDVYPDLDVVVLTSNNEGTPVAILEALAAARPVVATAVGGVPDLIGRNERGILVTPRDVRGVADAVQRLLSQPEEAARLGRAGRAYVYPTYDIGTLVGRIEDLYLQLADERGIPRGLSPAKDLSF